MLRYEILSRPYRTTVPEATLTFGGRVLPVGSDPDAIESDDTGAPCPFSVQMPNEKWLSLMVTFCRAVNCLYCPPAAAAGSTLGVRMAAAAGGQYKQFTALQNV